MTWHRVQASWEQVKDKVVFRRERLRALTTAAALIRLVRRRRGGVKAVIGKRSPFVPTTT